MSTEALKAKLRRLDDDPPGVVVWIDPCAHTDEAAQAMLLHRNMDHRGFLHRRGPDRESWRLKGTIRPLS